MPIRDRGGYAGAASEARPEAIRVADRRHPMENASAPSRSGIRPE
jgi:hypothetical protein